MWSTCRRFSVASTKPGVSPKPLADRAIAWIEPRIRVHNEAVERIRHKLQTTEQIFIFSGAMMFMGASVESIYVVLGSAGIGLGFVLALVGINHQTRDALLSLDNTPYCKKVRMPPSHVIHRMATTQPLNMERDLIAYVIRDAELGFEE